MNTFNWLTALIIGILAGLLLAWVFPAALNTPIGY